MEIFDIEQGSPEWFAQRKGVMTCSHAQEIGNNGKGLETYIRNMMAEYYSRGEKTMFSNEHTERGHELEDQAASIYAINSGQKISTIGFIKRSAHVGGSPDRLVDRLEIAEGQPSFSITKLSRGLLEVKCPDDVGFFKHLLDGEKAIDTKYVWQIQMQLLITGAEWCDYLAYNPNYEQTTFIYRFYPDPVKFAALERGFIIGEELIKTINKKLGK